MDVSLGTFLKETKGDKYMYEEYVKEFQIVEKNEFEKESDLLNNINNVKNNLNNIYKNMQFAEGDLIDYYAYQIKAEEAKYNYLIKQAKKKKLKIL